MNLSFESETKSKYKWIENLSRGYSFNYIWRSSIDLVREGKQKASGGPFIFLTNAGGRKKNICENNGDEMMTFLILLFYFIYLLHLYLSFDLLLYRYSVY